MTGSPRGRRLLEAQANREAPIDDPPDWMPPEGVEVWRELAATCADVLRARDSGFFAVVTMHLLTCRRAVAAGTLNFETVRIGYRLLGHLLLPIAERRRLIFGDTRPPSRSRRV
jgi:hypothetical protein